MNSSVKVAREFAILAHGDQKYGEHGYSYHLDAVADLLVRYGEDAQILGYLHDTVEDTSVTIDDIERNSAYRDGLCEDLWCRIEDIIRS